MIGKDLIGTLMFNLYSDNCAIYREYVQNASDSIHSAIQKGILSPDEAHITISISPEKITIEDNGEGIPAAMSEKILKDIANSPKRRNNTQAGRFGYGRFSGGGYCKKLSFKTSYIGENCATELTFDTQKINATINNDQEMRAEDLLEQYSEFNSVPEEIDKHYFIVTLEDILPELSDKICNEDIVANYLKEVAPLSFEPSFKTQVLDDEIDYEENAAVRSYYEKIDCIKLTVNKKNNLKKPYKRKIQCSLADDEINRIRFHIFKDDQYGDLAWMWFAVTPFSGFINKETCEPFIGIRLRLHNILVGNGDYFDGKRFFKEERGNTYFVGEIHIIHNDITPTPQRDDLAPSPAEKKLEEKIRDFFESELSPLYKTASDLRSALNKFDKKQMSIGDLSDFFQKKIENNRYKNRLGYQYLLEIYRPKFEALFEKFLPKEEPPQESTDNIQTDPAEQPSTQDGQKGNSAPPQQENTTNEQQNEQQNGQQTEQTTQTTTNKPKPEEKKLEKLEKKLGSDKKDVVGEIIEIIDKNFNGIRKKESVYKTAKRIKDLILKELNKKK